MQQISSKKGKQLLGGIIFSIFLVALDQIVKYFAVLYLKGASAIPIISDVFELSYLENHGAAFGILQGQKTFFVIMTVVTLLLLIYLFFHIPEDKHFFFMRVIVILLVSGAIGNFIDRCINGYVVDFFYFKLINFPIFNVADIYVTVAAGLLILLFCFYYKEEDIDFLLEKLISWKKKERKK